MPSRLMYGRRRRHAALGKTSEKKEKKIEPGSNYNAFASMVIDEYKSRIAYIRARGFPRQRLCKAGLARWLQPVSGSLNNACDIRAGQTKCTLARTRVYVLYIYVYAYMYV